MSDANNFLGLSINRQIDGSILLSQPIYAEKVFEHFNMMNAYPVSTPAENVHENSDNKIVIKTFPFREDVGCLMYLAVATRYCFCCKLYQLYQLYQSLLR